MGTGRGTMRVTSSSSSSFSPSSSSSFQIYRLEDSCCLFTLQGHAGGITAIYIDQVSFLFHNKSTS